MGLIFGLNFRPTFFSDQRGSVVLLDLFVLLLKTVPTDNAALVFFRLPTHHALPLGCQGRSLCSSRFARPLMVLDRKSLSRSLSLSLPFPFGHCKTGTRRPQLFKNPLLLLTVLYPCWGIYTHQRQVKPHHSDSATCLKSSFWEDAAFGRVMRKSKFEVSRFVAASETGSHMHIHVYIYIYVYADLCIHSCFFSCVCLFSCLHIFMSKNMCIYI